MKKILFPRGVALWLKQNTQLTTRQICEFCGLDYIILESLNDQNTLAYNPIDLGHLTKEEIIRGEAQSTHSLKDFLNVSQFIPQRPRKYITRNFRIQKPELIAFILKNYENSSIDYKKLAQLFSTNRKFIERIANSITSGTKTTDPIASGFCTQNDIDNIINK